MPYNEYLQISEERYNILFENSVKFVELADDVNQKPINVFLPLSKKQIEELYLIREVSVELQKKKDDDLKKAEQQAAEAKEKANEVTESEVPSETPPAEA